MHQVLEEKIASLKHYLSQFQTTEVVAHLFRMFHEDYSVIHKKYGLSSPYKQLFYLLGILLGTREPTKPINFLEENWQFCCGLIESIYEQYTELYNPEDSSKQPSDEWIHIRITTFPVFMASFNTTGVYASVQQLAEQFRETISPFDNETYKVLGLSGSDAIDIADWISNDLQKNMDASIVLSKVEAQSRQKFIDRAEREEWDLETITKMSKIDPDAIVVEQYMRTVSKLFVVRRSELVTNFGQDQAEEFWNLFVSRRGAASTFTYPTELNPAERQPLFEFQNGVALCTLANSLYYALTYQYTDALRKSANNLAFYKRRDKRLERRVTILLQQFFDETAEFFPSSYEQPNGHYEHDLVVIWKRKLFIIEAKATPLNQPFRDPEKAFIRIQRDFKSDGGLQKAYDQANRLRTSLKVNDSTRLYDEKGNELKTLLRSDIDRVYCICVTADNFGAIATDLSLLLVKQGNDEYPWAVNIFDLETILDGFLYMSWDAEYLCKYLDDRMLLHGKIFTLDEMEFGGLFISNGGTLQSLIDAPGDRIVLKPELANPFVEIYNERHGGKKAKFKSGVIFTNIDQSSTLLDQNNEVRYIPNRATRRLMKRSKRSG